MTLVVLVGPPGAGKTTVGRALAARRSVAFRDTDTDVEQLLGATVADIFVDQGEPAFRAAEAVAVRTALAEHDGVLALGGGAVLDAGTRAALAEPLVVFLDVSLAAAVPRVGLNRDRPLLLSSPRSQLKALMDARHALYQQVADHVVDTSTMSVDAVVDEVDRLAPRPGEGR
jgi:shikimate kinase